MQVEARNGATFENLVEAVDTLMKYAAESKAFTGLSSSLQAEIPQLYFDVDRDKAKFLGIPMSDIFSTMKAYTGSVYVNDFNMFNRVYKVYIQAEAPYRAHKDNINMFFVKTAGGDMVPLTALGDAEYTTGPGNIRRFNMFTTAVVRGAAAPGYSSGEVMRKMENIAKTHLPENIGVEWSGLSYQEKKAEGQLGLVLTLVFLFVFLFLAALYESWLVPVAVLLSLPVAALGAYLGILGFGLENDIYFQIGLVTLIGLALKCDFDCGVCQDGSRQRGRCGCRCQKCGHVAFPPDPDDFAGLCVGYVASGVRHPDRDRPAAIRSGPVCSSV